MRQREIKRDRAIETDRQIHKLTVAQRRKNGPDSQADRKRQQQNETYTDRQIQRERQTSRQLDTNRIKKKKKVI